MNDFVEKKKILEWRGRIETRQDGGCEYFFLKINLPKH